MTVPVVSAKAVAPKQPTTGGWRHEDGLRPPVQQEMQEPRFAGELRAERGQLAGAASDLGLRPVVRPVRPAQPPVTVEIDDAPATVEVDDGEDGQISVTSRSTS